MLSEKGATRPGRLRRRLVLQKHEPVPDGAGGALTKWRDAATLAADIIPVSASERGRGEGLIDAISHRIIIRWRGDIAGGDRFKDMGRLFFVRALSDPAEDGRYLVCQCEEVSA